MKSPVLALALAIGLATSVAGQKTWGGVTFGTDEETVRKQYGKPLTEPVLTKEMESVKAKSREVWSIYSKILVGEYVPVQLLTLQPNFLFNSDHRLASIRLSSAGEEAKAKNPMNGNILAIIDFQEKLIAKYGEPSSANADCSLRDISLWMKLMTNCVMRWRDSENNQIISLNWYTVRAKGYDVHASMSLTYDPIPSDF